MSSATSPGSTNSGCKASLNQHPQNVLPQPTCHALSDLVDPVALIEERIKVSLDVMNSELLFVYSTTCVVEK